MSIPGSATPLLLATTAAEAAAAYQVDRSLRFNDGDSAYLSKTFASAGNRKTWTWSGWVKRSAVSTSAFQNLFSANNSFPGIRFNNVDQLELFEYSGSYVWRALTNAVFRDPSAWYHICFLYDTTQATAADRIKLYVNNQIQTYSSISYPSQNRDGGINSNVGHTIGCSFNGGTANEFFDGYLTDVHFIDGQALAPTDFGEYDSDNNWNPKAYSGTYGTNGFHLDFSDATSTTTIAEDSSGNNNDWTANNISVTSGAGNDSLIDTPTNYDAASGNNGGNYCTWNPVQPTFATTSFSNGNLDSSLRFTNGTTTPYAVGTFAVSSGKWYWEITLTQESSDTEYIGFIDGSKSGGAWAFADIGAYFSDARKAIGTSPSSYGATYTTGDVIGVALDADNGSLTFYKNGTSQGVAATGMTFDSYKPFTSANGTTTAQLVSANFGQRPFAYTPPTGYLSLCTTNLPDPTIADGSTVMDVKLYTGNGSTQTISGLGFSPDLVWMKMRSTAGYSHKLVDQVRGATKSLVSNNSNAELTETSGLTAFTSDGFSLGSQDPYNRNNDTFVGWVWDAGTSTVSNTDGSITSSVRANASAGFSIVTYTGNGSSGATVGHGLNATPGWFTIACRNTTNYWDTWHSGYYAAGSKNYIRMNSTGAAGYASDMFQTPTSSVVTLGTSTSMNGSNNTYVMYCWTPVEGYSAFGSYTGTGTSDDSAPFIYTGMRPRWILIKGSSFTSNWFIQDNERDGYNVNDGVALRPNLSSAEDGTTTYNLDILSNGFKLRTSAGDANTNGATFIWAAFASNPFKTARAR